MSRKKVIAQQYLDKVMDANARIKEKTVLNKYGYDYCVLNDVGCDNIREDNFSIEKGNGKNAGFHAKINGKYEDPDAKSVALYELIVYKYLDKKIEKFGIDDFKVSIRGENGAKQYMYCITAKFDNKSVNLAGDWVISWNIIADLPKSEQYDMILKTHTIKGHPLWPCEQIDNRNTVNQVRKDKIPMNETLKVLKKCYDNKFELEKLENKKEDISLTLAKAFIDYKDWYLKFNTYKDYIEFWDLKCFENVIITKENICDIFSNE